MEDDKLTRRSACLLIASLPAWSNSGTEKSVAPDRVWLGPEFWANPLQDWQLRKGRIECVIAGGQRNVYLLTRELTDEPGTVSMTVDIARLEGDTAPLSEGFVGYRLGIKGEQNDYRDSAIYGIGLNAGMTTDGRLFIGELEGNARRAANFPSQFKLAFDAQPNGNSYVVKLAAMREDGGVLASISRSGIPAEWLTGGLGLICHSGPVGASPNKASIRKTASGPVILGAERGGNVRFSFGNWQISGAKVRSAEDRSFGPLLWAMHTLSKGVLKLTAQFMPVEMARAPAHLEIERHGKWVSLGSAPIDALSRTATFRVANWKTGADTRYRVVYSSNGHHTFEGVIRKDPVDKPKIVLASLSCLNDFGFPHSDLLRSIQFFQPDLLAFQGDQIYERAAGFGIQRLPLETATLDYLRKWYLFGWSFRDLMRNTPVVCMPDDHDVFHGNVWGAGGRHAEGTGQDGQDSGGYLEPARWVDMVQRTQTSHLPDPYDPAPVEQGIGVYYTELLVGGISFAILEDRKWKSAPKMLLPNARIKNGWAQNPTYSAARDGDVPGAELFGARQIHFLEAWGQDWRNGTWLKVALSQTLMVNLATLPPPANTDAVVPSLPIAKPGEYIEGDVLVADHDSNGWPQSGRNRALRALRRCAALHLCGDQHLGSTVQYGVEEWGDAAYAMCSPALSNLFPRRWNPSQPGINPKPHNERNTGDYLDGFGNKMSVCAVFNPEQIDAEPNPLMDRSPGFAIVEFDRADHSTKLAVWPRRTIASDAEAKPASGWPVKIYPMDNGWSKRAWVLDEVSTSGRRNLCVQVREEASQEIIYTIRIHGDSFVLPVPRQDKTYSVRIFDPDGSFAKVFKNRKSKATKS